MSTPYNCIATSKQRVIDRFVVGYGTEYQFKLSVTPYGFPDAPDIVVNVNGTEVKSADYQLNGYTVYTVNNKPYVNLQNYLTVLLSTTQSQPPVVEVDSYTHGLLDPASPGYFEIPQQLEANPTQLEVGEISGSELINQFTSIISRQEGIKGVAFGGPNNYRDTLKNNSLGSFILQNTAPALKSMLISSSDDLDFIAGVRFSQNEYTKFKNKFLNIALQLINQEFSPIQYHNNTIIVSQWVDEIIKTITISKEFSNAFAYSYMIANGTPVTSEIAVIPADGLVILSNYLDLSKPENAIYVYDTTGHENLLIIGVDYEIVSINNIIELQFDNEHIGKNIFVAFYKNPLPAYIPSTPTKVGTYGAYIPRIEWDTSYVIPTWVIIGHDGSKSIAYGTYDPFTKKFADYRDQLLLELEKRIYNLLQYRFRNEYYLPLRVESVKSGYFRKTRYSRQEYLDITESYLNKWTAKNRANYRVNDWVSASASLPQNSTELWKLYNYSTAISADGGNKLNLPGNWKGIYQYYYDTIYPNTRPWEMLGFSTMPIWWLAVYGANWSSNNTEMWQDLEAGIIRQGPSAIFDPDTLEPQPQAMWARPGMIANNLIPVDSDGNIRPILDLNNYANSLFAIAYSGNPYAPFDGFDNPWAYGDGSPVEQAWMSTSAYTFNVQEFLYLMRPGPFGEWYFDTLGTQSSPGMITVPGSFGTIFSFIISAGNGYKDGIYYNCLLTGGTGYGAIANITVLSGVISAVDLISTGNNYTSGNILTINNSFIGNQGAGFNINITSVTTEVLSNANWQYVQNDVYTGSDPLFSWMRPKNKDQYVHAETVDTIIQIRYGYQRWISDRILFLGSNVGSVFGQKVRTLDVNLANKLAGFTNKDTTTTYIESVSTSAKTSSLLIPTNNFDVILHTGQPIKTYTYSGVIIRALADGKFVVYGYDLLNSAFNVLDRSNSQIFDITIGGTPAEFRIYTLGETYYTGEIVRYNGVYYQSIGTILAASKFVASNWVKLKTLPTVGGVSVVYKPISEITYTTVPYGSILNSAQEVFDLLIGWGAYLESQGWEFTEVSADTNQLSDWLYSAKQFLFWLNSNWAPDASIQVSPAANNAMLTVKTGYPNDVETISNGVYSILDKAGVAIPPSGTTINRDGKFISVSPMDLSVGGIYFLQVSASETEHVLIFDNETSFNDVVYNPLLRARQQRIRFNGFRSNNWYGKKEAGGYLIMDNQLVPNYDTIVDSMKYYYDPDITIDNPSLEALGRHLIGYESKSYLDNLQLSNDVQYLFYQGAIRQKGTIQSLDKLFRSSQVQRDEVIEVYEEWALKLSNFGNTIEQVSTEFILKPEQNTGEVVVARLNFVPSTIGFVKEINILNAENKYKKVPNVIISVPDYIPAGYTEYKWGKEYTVNDTVYIVTDNGYNFYSCKTDCLNIPPSNTNCWALDLQTKTAKAYAILDSVGIISRIDIIDRGYGYLTAPDVTLDSGSQLHQLDKFYAVWQGEIIKDEKLDNVVDIDIDNTDIWTVRPEDPTYSLVFPTTKQINYSIPNAGYVNFNDVNWASYSSANAAATWGTSIFNPLESETIWIADSFIQDWDVYKLTNIRPTGTTTNPWQVVKNAAGNLLLITDIDTKIVPQLSTVPGYQTDFGNMICLQIVKNDTVAVNENYFLQIIPSVGYDTTNPWGSPGTYTDPTTLVTYNSYDLLYLDSVPVLASEIGNYEELTDLLLFKTMRFMTLPDLNSLPSYINTGDKLWIDNVDNLWNVSVYNGIDYTPFRIQESLIDTKLFENSQVFQFDTNNEIVLLPVYDPFKDILPAPAKQNITYTTLQDPATYNVTGEERIYNANITFGEAQVGKLWWDTSTMRYTYYEQPIALDGSETTLQNLVYRRDRWGQLFPGSTITIYEWVKSPVPPSLYNGTGTPKDLTTYVQISTSDRFTNATTVNYYFWVLNATDKPNIENRTLAAIEVAQLLATPKSQGFAFFSPIQQTEFNNSYMFYNVQQILAYQGNNVQVQYRVAERNDQPHTQWKFFREGDKNSIVTTQYWDKMVDSICGYTKVLPISDKWDNSIIYGKDLPWDIYGWDVAPFDDAVDTTHEIYGEILSVPDPQLSPQESYGIDYRPRQGMFVDIYAARKVFVQSANSLLKHIPIRESNEFWLNGLTTDEYQGIYWDYTNWYEVGFEDVTPTIVFSTTSEAQAALNTGKLKTGTILEVINGTADNRYVLYSVVELSATSSTQSLDVVCIENSAIKLFNTIYTTKNVYSLSFELRSLLKALRTEVFINNFIVDQNELYFSMLNYVVSEQKNPDWVFKSSYIYIKENNIPLTQPRLYVSDQINNIIDYIIDAKPYHTQIRDYTTVYTTSDLANGTAIDMLRSKTTIQFGPNYGGPYEPSGWDTDCDDVTQPLMWDSQSWDVCPDNYAYIVDPDIRERWMQVGDTWDYTPADPPLPAPLPDTELPATVDNSWDFYGLASQFISSEPFYTVALTTFDPSKVGYSELFPYTFSLDSIEQNNPQTIDPEYFVKVISIRVGDTVLTYGKDYYVEYNNDSTYTAYFFNDPIQLPEAFILWNGGPLTRFRYGTNRTEIAYGDAIDTFVVNVNTKLPVTIYNGTMYACSPLTSDGIVAAIITANGGIPVYDQYKTEHGTVDYISDAVISYKQNLKITTISLLNSHLIVGKYYTIVSVGSTDFTTIGASSNTVGVSFIATGVGSGSGIVSFTGNFYRNSSLFSGILESVLLAPTATTENLDVILVSAVLDILPNPTESWIAPGLWINGERIEYSVKEQIDSTTWRLTKIKRGTLGTAPVEHSISSTVWVEKYNDIPGNPNTDVWNATNTAPNLSTILNPLPIDPATNQSVLGYGSVTSVSPGGIWYAPTTEARFLRESPGNTLP